MLSNVHGRCWNKCYEFYKQTFQDNALLGDGSGLRMNSIKDVWRLVLLLTKESSIFPVESRS